MRRIDPDLEFSTLDELFEEMLRIELEEGEEVGMGRIQYAKYKRLVWEWMATRPDPMKEFAGHKLIVSQKLGPDEKVDAEERGK